jgi:hypothetical protein
MPKYIVPVEPATKITGDSDIRNLLAGLYKVFNFTPFCTIERAKSRT